ncbi:MAG: PAS domain-containing protein [Alphaproteobacteria bacterium]|nr:PAS domain-containing protein [Alphaproteobacteria bacterium]
MVTNDNALLDCPIVVQPEWPKVDESRLARFLRHWAVARAGAAVPRHSAIDPGAIIPCLPFVYIYLFNADTQEFTRTLAGEEINTAWGQSIIGKRQQDFMPSHIAWILQARVRSIVETPALLLTGFRGGPVLAGPRFVRRIIGPLSRDDGAPFGIFGISVYVNDPVGNVPAPVAPTVDAVLYDCKALPSAPP